MSAISTGRRFVGAAVAVVVLVAAGSLVGFFGARGSSVVYTSSSTLLWDPSSLRYSDSSAYVPDSGSLADQVAAQIVRATSDDVVEAASASTKLSQDEVRAQVTVLPGATASEIVVSGTGESASVAQKLTKAVATAYARETRSDLADQLGTRADSLGTSIDNLTARVAALPATDPVGVALANQLSDEIVQQANLRAQAMDPATPLSTVTTAALPAEPSSPSARTLALVGGAVGFVIAVGLLVLLSLRTLPTRSRSRPLARQFLPGQPTEAA